MAITRLNHAVLYVSDVERSAAFYSDVLGFRRVAMTPAGLPMVFLQAPDSTNDHDLGLFQLTDDAPKPRKAIGLYHLAWEVDTLDALEQTASQLAAADALVGTSDHGTTKSVYGKDPDGIEFEVVWVVPAHLLDDDALASRTQLRRLDLAAAKQRYGATTPGGIGVSVPA